MTGARSGSGDHRDGRSSRGSRVSQVSQGRSGGIEPLWDRSKAIAGGFKWRRRGQLEPMLEQLRDRHGETPLWRLAIACLEPLRSQHVLMPLVLDAAATAFCRVRGSEEVTS